MDEVRIRVSIANAMDEMRLRRGEIVEADVRAYETDAIVDVDAVRTMIPLRVQSVLGVGIRGSVIIGGSATASITGGLVFNLLGRDTVDEALIGGDEVRVGFTVINKLDLKVDETNRRLVPNPAHPDQPVSKVK